MAIAVASTSTTAYASSITSVTITKPSGLQVGDIMVAVISYTLTTATTPTPSGWTAVVKNLNKNDIYQKVADSSDVAASNFTFNLNDIGNAGGSIMRITGGETNNVVFDFHSADVSGSASPLTVTHTMENPALANVLLVMSILNDDNDVISTVSGHFVTGGTNPTWTTLHNFNDGGEDSTFNTVYATYASSTQITAFGHATTDADGSVFSNIALLILRPQTNGDGTHAQVAATCSVFDNSSSSSVPPSDQVVATCTTNTHTTDAVNPTVWTNETKNSSTWTNEEKSS